LKIFRTYSVSYDFHLLDPGFNTVQKTTDAGTYICVPKEFPRCRITVTQAQLDDLLRFMQERMMASLNTRVVLPPPTMPPPSDVARATIFAQGSKNTATSSKIEGLPDGIDPSKPSRNYTEARMRPDAPQWMDAYTKVYQGIMDRKAVDMVKPSPGVKILGTTTRLEYKIDNTANSPSGKHACACVVTSKWKARITSSKTSMRLP
jgi:hypothetical protein